MKKTLEEISNMVVEISGSCLYNIMRNIVDQRRVVENKTKEAIGDLIGRIWGSRYVIINAYPWQNSRTEEEEATYKDWWARKQVLEIDRQLRERKNHKYGIIGQYHSHIFDDGEKREGYLTEQCENGDGDVPFFRDIMKIVNRKESIQIVASVRIKRYKTKQETDEIIKDYKDKIKIIWKKDLIGYDVVLDAFWLPMKGNFKKIKLKRRKVRVVKVER